MKKLLQSLFVLLFIAISVIAQYSTLKSSVMAKDCRKHPPEIKIKTQSPADRTTKMLSSSFDYYQFI